MNLSPTGIGDQWVASCEQPLPGIGDKQCVSFGQSNPGVGDQWFPVMGDNCDSHTVSFPFDIGGQRAASSGLPFPGIGDQRCVSTELLIPGIGSHGSSSAHDSSTGRVNQVASSADTEDGGVYTCH